MRPSLKDLKQAVKTFAPLLVCFFIAGLARAEDAAQSRQMPMNQIAIPGSAPEVTPENAATLPPTPASAPAAPLMIPTPPLNINADFDRNFLKNLTYAGINYEQNNQDLAITIDEKKAMAVMPNLESQGVIGHVNPALLATAPLSVTMNMVGVSFAVIILNKLYREHENLDKLHVQLFVIPNGSTSKELCYFFDYDRNQFKNLDMSILSAEEFIMDTPSFQSTQWCKTMLTKER